MHHEKDELVDDRAFLTPAAERTWLIASSSVAVVIAVFAVLWGLFSRSQVILLDGVYASVTLFLSWLAIRASSAMEKGPTDRYPFGREALAPLMVAIQGLVLLGSFGYASLDAIQTIVSGGSDTRVRAALVYAIVTSVAAFVMWFVLRRLRGQSDLVDAEAAQWLAGMLLSVAMVLGFAIAIVLEHAHSSGIARYADPVLVLVAAAILVPVPVKMLRTSGLELLEATPGEEVTQPINEAIERVRADFGLPVPVTRIGKLGRKLYVEVDFLTDDTSWTVEDADRVRRAMATHMKRPGQLLWLNVELHCDPHWDD